jgi:hypothetical protein
MAESGANGFPRRFNLVLLAVLALGAVTLRAQQPNLVGHWRGVDRGATLTIVIQPDGRYSQTTQSGEMVTHQSGQFKLIGPSRLAPAAANSPARTAQINHATPAGGSSSPGQRTEMPLGATNTIAFTGPNRIVFTDEKTHRSITMTRVP